MTKKQQIPSWAWIIIALLILILLNHKGIINLPSISGTIVEPESSLITPLEECSITLDKHSINVGESVKGTISDRAFANCEVLYRINNGFWGSVGTYQLDSNGQFSYEAPVNIPGTYEFLGICTTSSGSCKTDIELLTVLGSSEDSDESTGPEVGDVLDSWSNSGTHPAGSGSSIWGIYPEGVELGGDCSLGIRLNTQLSYVEGEQCENVVDIYFHGSDQPWSLLGSSNIPGSQNFDLCPVYWDGSLWAIKFESMNMDCSFNYAYDYEIYICEC